eukprot:TRINITY_DN71590_c0_g1_i1.p1 TRINITY_DN71590_c0_g1~~TRINITY_DN71590_c0_g1_i1.p1  ORF type:complete len:193 (+),score=32.80 TRINITY_DN71590_c0_g1_i1:70-648(+)
MSPYRARSGVAAARAFAAVCGLLLGGAEACACEQYRCKSSGKPDFVFALTDTWTDELKYCIRNDTAFSLEGSCRYCNSCVNNVCECGSNAYCDAWPVVLTVICVLLAVGLMVISVYKFYRYMHVTKVMPFYEAQDVSLDSRWMSIILPAVGALCLIGVSVGLLYYRQAYVDKPPAPSAATTTLPPIGIFDFR